MRRTVVLPVLWTLAIGAAAAAGGVEARVLEIRREYKLINGDAGLKKDTIEIAGETTEGAVLYVHRNSRGGLRKLESRYYGEAGQTRTEYYVKDGKLVFAFVQEYRYNKPVCWTEEYVKNFEGEEPFDIRKSEILENRYYFDGDGNLVRWIDAKSKTHQDGGRLAERREEVLAGYRRERGRIE